MPEAITISTVYVGIRRTRKPEDPVESSLDVRVIMTRAGKVERLSARTDLVNHSPSGFECGYAGSGPAQLALAILAHHFRTEHVLGQKESDERAIRYHQQFKVDVVARLPREGWILTDVEVFEAVANIEARRMAAADV